MANVQITREYVVAGNACFTVSNGAGNWYTFKVRRKEFENGVRYFAKFMNGQDNEGSYAYLGMIDPEALTFRTTPASQNLAGSTPAKALAWALDVLAGRSTGERQAAAEIMPSTRCCRCGRLLTTPDSVNAGIGPECAGRVSVAPLRPTKASNQMTFAVVS